MGLEEDFQAAAKSATDDIPDNISNDEKLELYALFKQSTVGDCNTSRPGIFDQKGRYKWDAWDKKKGLSQEDAKKAYIELVNTLKAKYPKA
uniref:ACB domain-containing protein n=1 Tax=Chlamydomonas leiostraca TaxID=1034604 RepID=A0A7S0WQC6_9CHLO